MNFNENLDLKSIKYFCEYELIWKTERWKDILEYENKYQVSDLGRVKSLNYDNRLGEKILKLQNYASGHKGVRLYKNGVPKGIAVHILVAVAFLKHIRSGHKIVVDHINNIPNDNYYMNLQLISSRENASKDRISKHVGVIWCKEKKKWRAEITIGVSIFLGRFNDIEKAKAIYKLALNNLDKFHGCKKSFRSYIKSL